MPREICRLRPLRQLPTHARPRAFLRRSPAGTGRAIPLNPRILNVLEMWAAQFPERKPDHFIFPAEKYGAVGQDGTFGRSPKGRQSSKLLI